MKNFAAIATVVILLMSCDKVIDIQLPPYQPQVVVEMYLEEGKPFRCLVTESVSYTDTAITKIINDADVTISDGTSTFQLTQEINEDEEYGRFYNYFNSAVVVSDPSKEYTLTVRDKNNRTVTATTKFSPTVVEIDSLVSKASTSEVDSFSVGVLFNDPAEVPNYYRFVVGRKLNDFTVDPTDFSLPDVSFNGKPFSFYTEAMYSKGDTVLARIYSLTKEHYDYRESVRDARRANFNPFTQPGRIKSNVKGGLGIFTSIRYHERRFVIP